MHAEPRCDDLRPKKSPIDPGPTSNTERDTARSVLDPAEAQFHRSSPYACVARSHTLIPPLPRWAGVSTNLQDRQVRSARQVSADRPRPGLVAAHTTSKFP